MTEDFSVTWSNLWLKVEPGKSSQVFAHVLYHSSFHLCLETNSFYWHCTIFGTALSAVLSCFQTWGIIKACIVLRRLNSRLRGNKRIKTDFRSLFVNFGIICAHEFDLVNTTQCLGLSRFAFPSFPSSLTWLCWVCSHFFFSFSNKSLSESLSEMVSSPFMECNSQSSSSSLVIKQHVTN